MFAICDLAHQEYESFRLKKEEDMLAQALGWMLLSLSLIHISEPTRLL